MPSRDVPSEIYLKIFNLLEKEDIFTCIHVCKSWYGLATQIYYELLVLKPNNIKQLRKHMVEHKQKQQQQQQQDGFYRNLQWIKRLVIDDRDEATTSKVTVTTIQQDKEDYLISTKFEKEEFLSIISALTNITVFDISCSVNYEYYMTILRDNDLEGCMEYLEEIPKRSYYSQDELYFAVCFKFRKSLTHLSLSALSHTYSTTTTAAEEQQYTGNWLYFLAFFKNITHLSIYKIQEEHLLFAFLEICPKLISVKFLNNIVMLGGENRGAVATTTNNVAPYSYYSKQLKTLKMWLPTLKDPYLTYFQHYLPNHLDTLHIDMNNIDFNNWILGLEIDTLSNLGKSMSTISNLTIRANHNNGLNAFDTDDDNDHTTQTATTTRKHSKATRFYVLVGAIEGNRNLMCAAVYKQSDMSPTLIRVEDNKCMLLKYRIDYQDYDVVNTSRDSILSLPLFQSYLASPNPLLVPMGLKIINRLTFALGGHDFIPAKILQYALENCPHLESIEITMWQGSNEYIRSRFVASSSSSISNFGDTNDTMVTPAEIEDNANNGRGKTMTSIPTNNENLTKLSLKGNSLSAGIIDLVTSYLPNIDTILYEHPSVLNDRTKMGRISNYDYEEEEWRPVIDRVDDNGEAESDVEEEVEEEELNIEIDEEEGENNNEEENDETDSEDEETDSAEEEKDGEEKQKEMTSSKLASVRDYRRRFQVSQKILHLEKFEKLRRFSARMNTSGIEFMQIIYSNSKDNMIDDDSSQVEQQQHNNSHCYSVKRKGKGKASKYIVEEADYESVDVYAEVLTKVIFLPTFTFFDVINEFTLYDQDYNLVAAFHNGVLLT